MVLARQCSETLEAILFAQKKSKFAGLFNWSLEPFNSGYNLTFHTTGGSYSFKDDSDF